MSRYTFRQDRHHYRSVSLLPRERGAGRPAGSRARARMVPGDRRPTAPPWSPPGWIGGRLSAPPARPRPPGRLPARSPPPPGCWPEPTSPSTARHSAATMSANGRAGHPPGAVQHHRVMRGRIRAAGHHRVRHAVELSFRPGGQFGGRARPGPGGPPRPNPYFTSLCKSAILMSLYGYET